MLQMIDILYCEKNRNEDFAIHELIQNFSPRLLTSKTSCFTLVETISSVY